MNFKKYPLLTATLGVLGCIVITGVVVAFLARGDYRKMLASMQSKEKQLNALRSLKVTPTEDNQKAVESNLKDFAAAEAALRAKLVGERTSLFYKANLSDPGQFGADLNSLVSGWRSSLSSAGVKLVGPKASSMAFGFSRYYNSGVNPPQASTAEVSRQTKIVDLLINSLITAKGENPAALVSVEREGIEFPSDAKVTLERDELPPIKDGVFRRKGLLACEAYRVRFVGNTEILRRFVNAITDSQSSLSVRGVEAVKAALEFSESPAPDTLNLTGAAPAQPPSLSTEPPVGGLLAAPDGVAVDEPPPVQPVAPVIVVTGEPLDMTVTIEFITLPLPPAPPAPKDKVKSDE